MRRFRGAAREWQVVGTLGRGGTSTVYGVVPAAAEGGAGGTVYALKHALEVERAGLLDEWDRLGRYARRAVELFGAPAAALFPAVHDHDPKGRFFVMDRVDGTPLAELLERGPPLAPGHRARIAADVAEALAVVEDAGESAPDLKADAVFWRPGAGRATIIDWNVLLEADPATGRRHARRAATVLDALFAGRPVEEPGDGASPGRWQRYPAPVRAALERLYGQAGDAREAAQVLGGLAEALDASPESAPPRRRAPTPPPDTGGEGPTADPLAEERRRFVLHARARPVRLGGAEGRAFVDAVAAWQALRAVEPDDLRRMIGALKTALHRSARAEGCLPPTTLALYGEALDTAVRAALEAATDLARPERLEVDLRAIVGGCEAALRSAESGALDPESQAMVEGALRGALAGLGVTRGRVSDLIAAVERWRATTCDGPVAEAAALQRALDEVGPVRLLVHARGELAQRLEALDGDRSMRGAARAARRLLGLPVGPRLPGRAAAALLLLLCLAGAIALLIPSSPERAPGAGQAQPADARISLAVGQPIRPPAPAPTAIDAGRPARDGAIEGAVDAAQPADGAAPRPERAGSPERVQGAIRRRAAPEPEPPMEPEPEPPMEPASEPEPEPPMEPEPEPEPEPMEPEPEPEPREPDARAPRAAAAPDAGRAPSGAHDDPPADGPSGARHALPARAKRKRPALPRPGSPQSNQPRADKPRERSP